MESVEKMQLRSDEVQQILSRPPHILVRVGIGMICSVVLLLVLGSMFFRYPDVVRGEVLITVNYLPVGDVLQSSERLSGWHCRSPQSVVAVLRVPMAVVGKLKAGQNVNVSIAGYPYTEFGWLRATVKQGVVIAQGDYCVVELCLPNQLKTSSGRQLHLQGQVKGLAEIFTDNRSFFARIFVSVGQVANHRDVFFLL